MKTIWLHSVRLYIQLGLFFYYKKITLKGKSNITKKEPILFLGNHQNALLDALLIATKSGRFCYFLTRAAVFKKPLVSRLLKSLNMLPVYRVRDGWSTITKNKSVFSTSVELLNNNNALTIFPEGSHNLARRVRPLSKGFTRIILECKDKYPDTIIHLIPVGFNYEAPIKKGSSVSIHFGKAIPSNTYATLNEVEATNKMKQEVFDALSTLTTHIPETDYDAVLENLTQLNADFTNPEAVKQCIASHFKDCQFKQKKQSVLKTILKPILYFILCLPIFIWRKSILPKIDELEFISTFRFAICLTLVPLWLLILFGIAIYSFGNLVAIIGLLVLVLLILLFTKA